MTCKRNLEVMDGPDVYTVEGAVEGVGDRLYGSTGDADSEKEREREAPAGIGVDTPRAFASLASR